MHVHAPPRESERWASYLLLQRSFHWSSTSVNAWPEVRAQAAESVEGRKVMQQIGVVPGPHRQFLEKIELLQTDERIVGVAVGGSFIGNSMDEFSDLDLVVALEPADYSNVMNDRHSIAATLGHLLAAFTGEHVGEPRLLICLYNDPLLHVDLKFVSLDDVSNKVEEPVVVWQRADRLTEALSAGGEARFPSPDQKWIEDRFWIWIHNATAKVGRGELFEAIDFLSFLRLNALGPLGLQLAGGRPSGVRRIEMLAPEFGLALRRTVAGYDAVDCLRAIRACTEIYRELRLRSASTLTVSPVEIAAMEYLSAQQNSSGDCT